MFFATDGRRMEKELTAIFSGQSLPLYLGSHSFNTNNKLIMICLIAVAGYFT